MTTDKDTLIQQQQELIELYRETMHSMKDRDIKAAEYLESVLEAIKKDESREMGIDHLNRYIKSLWNRHNAAS